MGERPGAIGRKAPLSHHYEDLRDPALGAKVPRCTVCGVPEERTITGRWSGDGRTYTLRVCAHCLGADKQPNPDPLHVPEAA